MSENNFCQNVHWKGCLHVQFKKTWRDWKIPRYNIWTYCCFSCFNCLFDFNMFIVKILSSTLKSIKFFIEVYFQLDLMLNSKLLGFFLPQKLFSSSDHVVLTTLSIRHLQFFQMTSLLKPWGEIQWNLPRMLPVRTSTKLFKLF